MLTILGSINCFNTAHIIQITPTAIASGIFPVKNRYIAQGIITAPAPNRGSKSTNPIKIAIITGYLTSKPIKSKNTRPINTKIKQIPDNFASAFI